MAKVKIQGNASGTGVLTVTAPNTSTDRTITLPDGTGTLIADDGNNNLVLSGAVSSVGANANASVVNRTGSDGDVISIKKDGSEKGNIGTNGSNIYLNSEGGTIKLQVSGTDTYNGDSTAWYPATDNAKDLGYASFRYKDLYLSGGLKVGGTGAANTLDDYEEGEFDASFSSSGASFSYTARKGYYTKIGNRVFYNIYMQLDGSQTFTSNQVTITGLPFASNGGGHFNSSSICETRYVDFDSGFTALAGRIGANTTSILLLEIGDGQAGNVLRSDQLSSSSGQVFINGSYAI
jgi:hypothetical protein